MARHASLRRHLVVCFLWLCAAAAVCRARDLQPVREAQEPLMVKSYGYASFDRDVDAPTLSVLKDASINGGALQLTPDTMNNIGYVIHKSGSVLLNRPFKLWRTLPDDQIAAGGNGTSTTRVRVASFNTTFSMNVYYEDAIPGEGLAFVIAPSLARPPPGSEGGFLGLTNATLQAAGPAANRFVAVEFDTFNQSYDPSANHVGLDIGSVVSNVTANLADFNITIATQPKNSANYTVWIEYDGVGRNITVYMGARGKPRPGTPVLAAPLDLSEHVPEHAYIGFSGSTGAAYELNCILDWTLWIETFPEDKVKKWWIVLVAVVGSVGVAGIAIAAFFLARISRARRAVEQRQARLGHTLSHLPGMPREFTYESLRKATNSFHEQLGEGAYGVVYKGTLPAEADDGRAEARIIFAIAGWCYKKGQLLLVYEYMPNGSLDQHLFPRSLAGQLASPLTWASRYAIAKDVASGLHYVHYEYGPMVLHRDIKASNVLLDASFSARVGDFGLARVVDSDRTSYMDAGVAGTHGYIAPEYSMGHRASRQTDVFAFGALVLELVTGRRALLRDASCPLLVDFVWRMHGRGALLGAVDQGLGTAEFDADEATRLLLLGLACSSPNPGDRPTMPEVLQILSKSAPPPDVPPVKPTFIWPPEGGARFSISDIEMMTSGGGSYAGTGDGSSMRPTQDRSSYDSFRPLTAPNNSQEYFPALSSGR
ncbi:probable L-type lectin-domain containing receptor kinase S.5 [Lolium rigidum]|uniref:probable L-type lectin-domain containing receptor kinase S.5 n=1 Tax=Lolium rigidum TaxID=89674 RepID=UPI001F5C9163|nr:probable L-type lectin-domain containing receptor kinase S.5 [Lolium rigidum]